MRVLAFTDDMWNRLRDHLLADLEERAAFLLARTAGPRLVVHDVVLVPDDQVERHRDSVSVGLPALIEVMNRAVREGKVLIEAHSHPRSVERVRFSAMDNHGQEEMVRYLSDVMPGQEYGALVFGQSSVEGKFWRDCGAEPIGHILVTGSKIDLWPANGGQREHDSDAAQRHSERHDRQVRAFGAEGQNLIRRIRVAVVGLGGIGSILSSEFAHLGLCDVILIDSDHIEESNLNRLLGATPEDVDRLKVDLAKDQFLRVNPEASVRVIAEEIRSESSLRAAASADVLVGCVDTDSGRLILNELAVTQAIPFIDCGTGIDAPEGLIEAAGGRVVVWVPGRPCLLCCGEIDRAVAAAELESDDLQKLRRQHGYISGLDVPEPSVISLNGTVASVAATEFLALLTGFRPAIHYSYYDLVDQRVGPRHVKTDRHCFTCSNEGIGDAADLSRYSE